MLPWVQPEVLKRLKLHEVLQLISSVAKDSKPTKAAFDEHTARAQTIMEKSIAEIKKEWETKKSDVRLWQVMHALCLAKIKSIDQRLDQENLSLELCWRYVVADSDTFYSINFFLIENSFSITTFVNRMTTRIF